MYDDDKNPFTRSDDDSSSSRSDDDFPPNGNGGGGGQGAGGGGDLRQLIQGLDNRLQSIESRIDALEARGPSTPGPGPMPGPAVLGPAAGKVRLSEYGGYSVHFDRQFNASIDKVFRIMTEPAGMLDWYADATVEPQEGGKVVFKFANSGSVAHGMVVEYQKPHKFSYMWVTGTAGASAQPMPTEMAQRGGTCGDLTLAASVVRYVLTASGAGTKLNLSHRVPMNPDLLAAPLKSAGRSADTVSKRPAPDMVLATWDISMDLLEGAISNPGNRAMSLNAGERSGTGWPWDQFGQRRAMYAQVL